MAFSDFQYPAVLQQLGLTLTPAVNLFPGVPPVAPGPFLRAGQSIAPELGAAAHTELSRMIWMSGPLLGDFWTRYRGTICLIAGAEFAADPAARLTGFCDFLICRAPQQSVIFAPVLVVFEAKRDSIPDGYGQCIAAMVGAQRFNARNNTPIDPVYGCVTTGTAWKFLRLSGTTLTMDGPEYALAEADRILGILTHIVGPPPAAPAAA
ncbi:MAG: hypothetical protein C0501_17860 [Isosphaera sp.]|nr:hypothetical protein [Isosphaera sp.]